MTLKEIDASLPRGFHDAEIQSIVMDYPRHRLTMSVALWVDTVWVDAVRKEGEHTEWFRLAEIVLEGVQFLAMDVPAPDYFDPDTDLLWVDLDTSQTKWTLPVLEKLPEECFASRFYVHDWNGFIYVAARSASFSWKGEPYDRWPAETEPKP